MRRLTPSERLSNKKHKKTKQKPSGRACVLLVRAAIKQTDVDNPTKRMQAHPDGFFVLFFGS
jgi:hypothetical protein